MQNIVSDGEIIRRIAGQVVSLCASAWLVTSYHILAFASLANVHFIVFAQSKVLHKVLSPSVLEPSPSSLSEDSSLISLLDLGVVHELEGSSLDNEDSLCALAFHAIFEISKLFPVEVELVLWIVLVLDVLRNLLKVCDHVAWVSLHNIVDQELDESLFR